MSDLSLPAWSDAFTPDARAGLLRTRPFGTMDRRAVFGERQGRGVTVAIIDSGVEPDHPAIGGRLARSLRVEPGDDGPRVVDDPDPIDMVGHGTACAGIVHAIAPAAELVSIRVLGPDNRAAGPAFAAALEWAIGERLGVVNLSLSSRSEAMAGRFHELADAAYFANTLLVAAANNVAGPSYPSLFAAVVSVAAHERRGPGRVVLQPGATGRIRRARTRRGRRLAGRHAHPGDRQLVRGATPVRSGGAHPGRASRREPIRGQGDAGGHGRRPADMTTPPGRSGGVKSGRGEISRLGGVSPSSWFSSDSPPELGPRFEKSAGGAGLTKPCPSTSSSPSIAAGSWATRWSGPTAPSFGNRIRLFDMA